MNILLTSVGRRSYLVKYFQEALGGEGKVIGANVFAEAPGMYAADEAVIVPPSNHPDYIEHILAVCQDYDIQLICSLHDLDVYILSQHRDIFENRGIRTTLPSPEWGRIALDKYECTQVLADAGIPVPWTSLKPEEAFEALNNGEISYPLVLKARLGFGSLGLIVCHSREELLKAYQEGVARSLQSGPSEYMEIEHTESLLIQPIISGREICIGICNDLRGHYQAHFSCEVHSMRAGESDSATSIDRNPFEDFSQKFSSLTRHYGIWGVDLLDDDGIFRVIDVNPRFTGDYPFHHMAGANIPNALIAWAVDSNVSISDFNHRPRVYGYKDIVPKSIIC